MAAILFLFAAGAAAAILGYLTGLASLASYPALLLLGVPPVLANTTNAVSLLGSGIGAVAGAWGRIRAIGAERRIWLQLAVALAAGLAGGVLLLAFPATVFERLVPWFVLAGTVIFIVGPRLRAALEHRSGQAEAPVAAYLAALVAANVYCGYFGAGAGTIILAVMAAMTTLDIHESVALKALIVFLSNGAAALLFIAYGQVLWREAIIMGIGAIAGGYVAPRIQDHISAPVMRALVAIGGIVLAIWLFRG